jgi:hypothetical protein
MQYKLSFCDFYCVLQDLHHQQNADIKKKSNAWNIISEIED